MKTFTMRDFAARPQAARRELRKESQALLTSNGRPIAILLPVNAETYDQALDVLTRARALRALQQIQRRSVANGLNRISMREIDAEIEAVRRTPRRSKGKSRRN